MSTELTEEVRHLTELHTLDIAIAGQKLAELALLKGGEQLAYLARREVRKQEYNDIPTIVAMRNVFHLLLQNKI